jgi:hypothetical protein
MNSKNEPEHEWLDRLRQGREDMAKRCEAAARRIAQEAGVVQWRYTKGLYGRASSKGKWIAAPLPTTRRRLYVWAHECAHVALGHDENKPVHRMEYEAERWAAHALRRRRIPVPRKRVASGKRYVAMKIRCAEKRGAKRIDPEALAWHQS